MDFHFFGHGKVMESHGKSMLKKRGHPVSGAHICADYLSGLLALWSRQCEPTSLLLGGQRDAYERLRTFFNPLITLFSCQLAV